MRQPAEATFDALLRVKVTPAVATNYGAQLLDRGDWVAFARHFILVVLRQGSFVLVACFVIMILFLSWFPVLGRGLFWFFLNSVHFYASLVKYC